MQGDRHVLTRALCAAALLAATAQAQTIYRCGTSYSQTPCAGGTGIEAPAQPDPARVREHEAGVRRVQKAADRLEQERRREETARNRSQRTAVHRDAPDEDAMEAYDPGRDAAPSARQPKYFTARSIQPPRQEPPPARRQAGEATTSGTAPRP